MRRTLIPGAAARVEALIDGASAGRGQREELLLLLAMAALVQACGAGASRAVPP